MHPTVVLLVSLFFRKVFFNVNLPPNFFPYANSHFIDHISFRYRRFHYSHKEGHENICSIDTSAVLIGLLRQKYGEKEGMEFKIMDARNMKVLFRHIFTTALLLLSFFFPPRLSYLFLSSISWSLVNLFNLVSFDSIYSRLT